jgi:hypothetical protein
VVQVPGGQVLHIGRFEDPTEEVDRLIEGVEGILRTHVRPQGFQNLVPCCGEARLSQEIAKESENLAPHLPPACGLTVEEDGDTSLIFYEDAGRGTPRKNATKISVWSRSGKSRCGTETRDIISGAD